MLEIKSFNVGKSSLFGNTELIEELITDEIREILDKYNIDPNDCLALSGLIQIDKILNFDLSLEEQLVLWEYALDLQIKMSESEKDLFEVLEEKFKDPYVKPHMPNFPILMYKDEVLNKREEEIKFHKKEIEILKQKLSD